MALVKCSECGGEVSTKAKECPGCGARVVSLGGVQWAQMSASEKVGTYLGFALLGLIGATVMIWILDWVIPNGGAIENIFVGKYYWWFFWSFFLIAWGTVLGWFHSGEMNS